MPQSVNIQCMVYLGVNNLLITEPYYFQVLTVRSEFDDPKYRNNIYRPVKLGTSENLIRGTQILKTSKGPRFSFNFMATDIVIGYWIIQFMLIFLISI